MPSVIFTNGDKTFEAVVVIAYQFLYEGKTSRYNIQTPAGSNEDLSPHTLQTAQIWYQIVVV